MQVSVQNSHQFPKMFSWHDFNKYRTYDTDAHLKYVNGLKSTTAPSRKFTLAIRNSTRSKNGTQTQPQPSKCHPTNLLCCNQTHQTPPAKENRKNNGSIKLFGSNLIGQERPSACNISETRESFCTPKPSKDCIRTTGKNSKSPVDRTNVENTLKQETPPFSLRKTVPKAKCMNKIIDMRKVAESISSKENNTAAVRLGNIDRRLYVLKGISSFAVTHNPGPSTNTFGLLENPTEFVKAAAGKDKEKEKSNVDDRFRFIVDMSEYHNDQIQFKVKGRKLIIEGVRPKQEPWLSERKTTESVQLPLDVQADNLRIDRDSNGLLYFQEAWKF